MEFYIFYLFIPILFNTYFTIFEVDEPMSNTNVYAN